MQVVKKKVIKKKDSELKLLNDLWRIIQYMMNVAEEEKAESRAFKKVFRDLQTAYPTKVALRKIKK